MNESTWTSLLEEKKHSHLQDYELFAPERLNEKQMWTGLAGFGPLEQADQLRQDELIECS
jgi:hypothetical protein